MNPDPSTRYSIPGTNVEACTYDFNFRSISWGAIFAGAATAMALQLLLTLLGSSVGLGLFEPMKDAEPVKNFSIGAAVIWTLTALVSLWCGGMVAGFFAHRPNHKSGGMHGLVVWSVVMLFSFALVSVGLGLTAGGAVKLVGGALGIGGKAVGNAAGESAKELLQTGKDQIKSFIDEAAPATNSAPDKVVRAKREIGFAITKLFRPENEAGFADNRTAAIKALSQYNNLSEADATKLVDEWIASYNNLKTEMKSLRETADRKAREAADKAANNLAWASIVTFVAFLLGLSVTVCGGKCGARCVCRHSSVVTEVKTA